MCLSCTIMEIWCFKDKWVTPLTFCGHMTGHVTSSVTWPFESREPSSYGWSMVTMRPSGTGDSFYICRVIAHFVPNFVPIATWVSREKFDWQHLLAHPPKPPFRRKNLAGISYTDRFIANFVSYFIAMAMGVGGRKCDWRHSMAHPWKSPYRLENLADISYTDRVIAVFVPNFVAMATAVGQGKCD